MKKLSRLCCLLLIIIFAFPLGGCSSHKDAYLYFELPTVPKSLDPQVASSDSELLIVKNIFEGLLRKNSKGEIACGVAESYEKKGLTYTFKLKEDAKWSNGDNLTADDFVFAFRRAVTPQTKAPFVSRLFSIKNARKIYEGSLSVDNLGIRAISKTKLQIILNQEDSEFEETLTTSIAMPCNEEFFYKTDGKYGVYDDQTLSNGSYRLSRWRKEVFGIRLYKNEEYSGDFEAENAAAFLTCNPEEDTLEKLQKNSIDIAFVDTSLKSAVENEGLKTAEFQNICWVLTLGDSFTPNMRKALSMLVGGDIYSNNLPEGYHPATSLFPDGLVKNATSAGLTPYNRETAKQLYLREVSRLEDKKFPSDIILYYYDDGNIKNVVTDIVGHWQNNFSAFVNIESVSDPSLLLPQLNDNSYALALFPVRADSGNILEYLKKFGINYSGEDLAQVQTRILAKNTIHPVMFQNTVIAYSSALSEVHTELGNGYLDFSFIIKKE